VDAELLVSGGIAYGSVLAGGGVSIVAVEAGRRRALRTSILAKRWVTWAWIGPLWLLASAAAVPRVFILTGIAVAGIREYSRLRTSLHSSDRRLALVMAAASIPVTWSIGAAGFLAVAVLAATVLPILSQDVETGTARIEDQIMGVALILVPVVLLWEIGERVGGGMLLAMGLAVALSDVGAFVVGKSWGSSRLAPVLSPGKTRMGLLGNLAGAAVGTSVASSIGLLGGYWMVVLPAAAAIGAVWGDLLESLLKREARVKDAGTWLPGFGGLLDRIDSLLVVTPLVYVLLLVESGGA
jgi:phosphatidate cytidylyltransferase